MTITSAIRRTVGSVLDYLRGFSPREDTYALGGDDLSFQEKVTQAGSGGVLPRVMSNPEAFDDLDIGSVLESVYELVPRSFEKSGAHDRKYLEDIFHYPVNDLCEIEERQEVITELQMDEDLWNHALAVKTSLDMCLYDERFRSAANGLKSLQDAANIVEFVQSIRKMAMPRSKRLKSIKGLGRKLDEDDRFREAESFMSELYIPYRLGDVIEDNSGNLRAISGVTSRRDFFGGNRILLEVAERMFTEEPFNRFLNDEAKALELLKTMRSRLGLWHKELFSFSLSGHDLDQWGKNERKKYLDLMEYWLSLMNEAVYSRVPKLEIGDLSKQLGFYLGAAALQRKWASAGFPVTNPKILDRREIKASIMGSFNTSLMQRHRRDSIVSNDVVSDRDHNLFILTGPNNGGKTTYIRQVGQMYWLAHIGMGIPVERAEISGIDSLFTSFNTEDNTAQGTGLYLTELKRIAQFSRPAPEQPCMSPYSIIFFDEFANGTDHEESVRRTAIVLDYLSDKGVTAYFTTHKHEIADMVDRGKLKGAVNLAAEARIQGDLIETTYRIIRNAKEKSYGYVQAEIMGITAESLRTHLMDEMAQGLYPLEDTRLNTKVSLGNENKQA